MVRGTFFWPYSMFSSVLPLVQMAQVTLGHPKDVNKEERKKSVWHKVSLSFLLISGSDSLSNHNKQKRDGLHAQGTIHIDDHTFTPTVPGTPGTPSFPAGPWTETRGREIKQ